MILGIVFLISAVGAYRSNTVVPNSFEATKECIQYNANSDYGYDIPYYSTANWLNVQTVNGTVRMRLGVSGNKSGYIRLAPSNRPTRGTTMHEIVLAFFTDNRSYLQRYVRTSASQVHSHKLWEYNFTQKISIFEPLMVTVEVYPNGRVTVTRDFERLPFIDATDAGGVSAAYVGFCNWNAADKAVFFIDCPLKS